MKKLILYMSKLLKAASVIVLAGLLFVAKAYAQESSALPEASVADLDPVPTPSPQIQAGKDEPDSDDPIFSQNPGSWTRFKYSKLIAKTAQKYSLEPQLIYATIMTESEGNEYAYRYEPHLGEPSLCMGQILVSTARSLGFNGELEKMYEPEICIDLIGRYYRNMLETYDELTPQQFARAYNTGSPWGRAVWGHISRFNSWYYEEV